MQPAISPRAPAPLQQGPAATPAAVASRAAAPLPKAPVLDWPWLLPGPSNPLPCVADLPHRAHLTSGRAALRAALRQLGLPPGSTVLTPTYHCPTMVAPVIAEGLVPSYFPIGADGLPLLQAIEPAAAARAKAMFVAHYFGLPASLAAVRAWCDERGIVLVEDCAHSYFGWAGGRPVGAWGDYATASLSKFFPLREGGLLASAHHRLRPLYLQAPSLRTQFKGLLDVLEHSHQHRRLQGWHQLSAPVFALKHRLQRKPALWADPGDTAPADSAAMMQSCDMARSGEAGTLAARTLHTLVWPGRVVAARQRNYALLAQGLAGAPGTRLPQAVVPDGAAPYVLPLWVEGADRADRIYQHMRLAGLPVFRWDRLWPGTPAEPHDHGPLWSRHMLQLLCHQDLRPADIGAVCQAVHDLARSH